MVIVTGTQIVLLFDRTKKKKQFIKIMVGVDTQFGTCLINIKSIFPYHMLTFAYIPDLEVELLDEEPFPVDALAEAEVSSFELFDIDGCKCK